MIKLNLNYAGESACEKSLEAMQPEVSKAHSMLHDGTGLGSDFLGWVDLPVNYDKAEFAQIKECAEKIKKDSQALVVLGIGGSYLGARAAIEFIKSNNYNLMKKDTPDIYFGGNTISSSAVSELIQLVEGK
ncbi:MAG: glucose-6-phosphate isomerase, partial [Acutalibacteraceae bacterium]